MNDIRIKPLDQSELIPMPSPEDLAKVTATVFGFAGGGISEWIRSGGRIISALWLSRGLEQFTNEIKYYHDLGKIKDGYFLTSQNFENLTEILDYFDKGVPNEQVWGVLRKIYFVAAAEKQSARDDILPQQYMRLAKSMSSAEILVLFAGHQLSMKSGGKSGNWAVNTRNWAGQVATISGLKHLELAYMCISPLIAKGLLVRIRDPKYGEEELFVQPSFQALSELGMAICKYVLAYEEIGNDK